jgi:hypothetical protein
MKRNKPTASRAVPPLGLPISLALHLCLIAATLVSWSHKLDIDDESIPVVPVDLVTVSDTTNIAPMTTEAPKPPEEPPQRETQDRPQVQPKPDRPAEVAPAADMAAVPRPAPPPPKEEKFDPNRILALLDKRKAATPTQKNARIGNQNIKGVGTMDAMTADLRAILKSEIYKCWSPPVGSPHPERLALSFRLTLRRDGSIGGAPQLEEAAVSASDPFMRAAVEAARRAIYTCAPYRLPPDRYSQWQDVTLVFDPRDMLGQ